MRRFFKTKMHQKAPPRPAGGAHSAPQDYLAVFREGQGPEKESGMGRRKGREKKGGQGKKGKGRKIGKRGRGGEVRE